MDNLPNELIVHILRCFIYDIPGWEVKELTRLNHRFYKIITVIIFKNSFLYLNTLNNKSSSS